MQADKAPSRRATLTDWVRARTRGLLEPIAAFFNRLGIHPNTMTLIGLMINLIGAFWVAQGWMTLGGLFIVIGGPFDALDGTMARLRGQPTTFGAFVDSVTDRWSEMLILFGLLYYYLSIDDPAAWLHSLLVFLATMGSVMVSYTKARAEALGYDCDVGVLTRMERYLVMAPGLLLNLPGVMLWIVAILANVTALQRALHVRAQARRQA